MVADREDLSREGIRAAGREKLLIEPTVGGGSGPQPHPNFIEVFDKAPVGELLGCGRNRGGWGDADEGVAALSRQ